MEGMARAVRPELRFGFEGEITFELTRYGTGQGPPDIDTWTFTVAGAAASVRPGPGTNPAVVFRSGLATFVRMGAGAVDPLGALFDRSVRIEGDILVGGRVFDMFGGVAALGAIEAVET